MFKQGKRSTAGFAALALVGAVAVGVVLASPAAAIGAPGPVAQRTPTTGGTADALPAAQIDGVVWAQAIVGNSVYAGGSFKTARPAGVAAGGPGTVARPNL